MVRQLEAHIVKGVVRSIVPGTGVTVDDTDPANPIVSATGGGGSGGGGGWASALSLPLTTLTGWTPGSGTWTASATGIRQSLTTTGVIRRLIYNTPLPRQGDLIAEVEVNVASNGTGARAGLTLGAPSTDINGGMLATFRMDSAAQQSDYIDFERDGLSYYGKAALAAPIADGTWITLRLHKVGTNVEAFVNGAAVASGDIAGNAVNMSRIHLHTNGSDATFRNLKVWVPVLA